MNPNRYIPGIRTAKIPYGEISVWRKFLTAKIPYGENSVRQKLRTAKFLFGEKSVRRKFLAPFNATLTVRTTVQSYPYGGHAVCDCL